MIHQMNPVREVRRERIVGFTVTVVVGTRDRAVPIAKVWNVLGRASIYSITGRSSVRHETVNPRDWERRSSAYAAPKLTVHTP